jgi:poly(3-hydroxybutyrate) depolymerase
MSDFFVVISSLLLSSAVFAQSSASATQQAVAPQLVEVPSGTLHLKGYLWKPAGSGPFPAVLFNHGSGGEDAQHTAGRTMAKAASDLAQVFIKHGYVFFYPCRRGQGLSADQVSFTQDLLKQAEAKGSRSPQGVALSVDHRKPTRRRPRGAGVPENCTRSGP